MTSAPPSSDRILNVGMVGHAFMGAAHSQAWRSAARFFDLPVHPVMRVLGGRDPDRTATAADRLGWARHRDRLATTGRA